MSSTVKIEKANITDVVRSQDYVSEEKSGRFDQLRSTDLIDYLATSAGDAIGFDFDSILDFNVIDLQQRWDITSNLDGLSFEIVDLGTNRLSYEIKRLELGKEVEIKGDPGFTVSGQTDSVDFDPFKDAENGYAERTDFVVVFEGVFDAKTAGDYSFDVNKKQKVEITFGDADPITVEDGKFTVPMEAGIQRFELKIFTLADDRKGATDVKVEVQNPEGDEAVDLFDFVSVVPDGLYDVTVNALIDGIADSFTFVVTDLADIKTKIVAHYGTDVIAKFGEHDGPVSLEEIADFMNGFTIAEFETFLSIEGPKTVHDFMAAVNEIEGNLSTYDALKDDFFNGRDIGDTQTLLEFFKGTNSLDNVLSVNTFALDKGVTLSDTIETMRALRTAPSGTTVRDLLTDHTALSEEEFTSKFSSELYTSVSNIASVLNGDEL